MIRDILQDSEDRMEKSLKSLQSNLTKIRTGRAHPDILNSIVVDYYGVPTALSQVANINVMDARTLSIQPWEKNMSSVIEKAIMDSSLGLNPVNLGDVLRLPLPPLNEERRLELTKVVRSETEKGKISIRNIRRDANNTIDMFLKDKEISEDDAKKGKVDVQKITDKIIKLADECSVSKEKDLLSL